MFVERREEACSVLPECIPFSSQKDSLFDTHPVIRLWGAKGHEVYHQGLAGRGVVL